MIGVVLWSNPQTRAGIVWCEDQGSLAVIGPDVSLPRGATVLESGDQLIMSVETRDGARAVRDVYSVASGGGRDLREILNGFHQAEGRAGHLSVVA